MPFEETRSLLEINLLSPIFLAKLVLPDMVSRDSGKVRTGLIETK
jgi:short-subunit dehydrogenase